MRAKDDSIAGEHDLQEKRRELGLFSHKETQG